MGKYTKKEQLRTKRRSKQYYSYRKKHKIISGREDYRPCMLCMEEGKTRKEAMFWSTDPADRVCPPHRPYWEHRREILRDYVGCKGRFSPHRHGNIREAV